MDIDILKEFITLSDRLNFSETAKLHYITQPVLSKHIQQLEETLGVTLFHRSRQSVELTMLGSSFLEDAQLIVATYDAALKKLSLAAEKYESSFSLAFLDAAAKSFLPKILSEFISANPSIFLELKNANIPETYNLLETRQCDMAITLKFSSVPNPDYSSVHLYRDPLCVVMNEDHPLSGRKSLTFEDIKEERFIAASPDLVSDYQVFLQKLLNKNNLSLSVKRESASVEEGFMLVESGYGISIVPQHQQFFASPHVKLVPLNEDDCFVDVVITWRKDNPNPNIPSILKLINQLDFEE